MGWKWSEYVNNEDVAKNRHEILVANLCESLSIWMTFGVTAKRGSCHCRRYQVRKEDARTLVYTDS